MTERAGSGCHLKYDGREDYRRLMREKMSVLSRKDSAEERHSAVADVTGNTSPGGFGGAYAGYQ